MAICSAMGRPGLVGTRGMLRQGYLFSANSIVGLRPSDRPSFSENFDLQN